MIHFTPMFCCSLRTERQRGPEREEVHDRRGGPELGAPVDRDGAGHAEELPQAEAAAELAEVEHLMAGSGRMQRPVDPRGDVSIETVAAEKPCRICAMKGTAQDTV